MSWTPPLRELVRDNAVLEIFDSLAAYLARLKTTEMQTALEPVSVPPLPTAPTSVPVDTLQFPPDYHWFSSAVQDGVSAKGANEEPPTFGTSGSAATYSDTNGFGRTLTTGASSGDGSGVIGGAGGRCTGQMDITWTKLVRTGSNISALRIWSLFTNTALSDSDNIGGISEYMGFRYSTVAGDTGWVGVCRDGTTQTVSSTVAAIATSTTYKLRMRKSGSTVYFSVDNGTEVSVTTNLPGATTELFWAISWWTKSAVARSMTWYRHWVRFGVYTPPAPTTAPLPTVPTLPATPAVPPVFVPSAAGVGQRFQLYKSANQTLAAGTPTAITWETEYADTADFFAGGSRVTVRLAGFYTFTIAILSGDVLHTSIALMVNGVLRGGGIGASANVGVQCVGGEIVEVYVTFPFSTIISANYGTWFKGECVA